MFITHLNPNSHSTIANYSIAIYYLEFENQPGIFKLPGSKHPAWRARNLNLKNLNKTVTMSFSVFDSDIILCSAENILVWNYENGNETIIQLPKLIFNKDISTHNNLDIDICHGITSVTFSEDGKYFCVCTNRKQLCIYKRENLSLISNTTLVRAASKVKFTPNNDIVIADKSGDAYLYKMASKEENAGTLILGHLSMLLDVLITYDNKYIITADRDEKIRVSQFPNAYNIESYCLGHTKFVSNISQLPQDHNILISAGGDGAIKLWDYKNGRELDSINYGENIPADDVKKLNENLQELELTEMVMTLPVKHLRLMQLDENSCIFSVSFYGSGNIFLYHVIGNIANKLNVKFQQALIEDTEPLECLWQAKQFWILNNYGLKVYKLQDNNNCIENTEVNVNLEKLNSSWKTLRSKINQPSFYPILYKRKFDTVQEYQERKKFRLMNVV